VSTIGTRVTSVAYPLLVLALTHSPAKAGIVGFAQSLPYLLCFLPAGALVDRWNRKRIMLVADAGRAIALGSLGVVLAVGSLPFAQIVAVAFIEGACFVFFSLAENAALPQIVPKEQLPTAVAQNQARVQGADLVGQPLGGALFGVSRLLPFVVDAVSYAVSFISLLFVRPAFQEERDSTPTRLWADIAEGVAWLWRMPFLRTTIFLVAGSNFAFNAIYLAMIVRGKRAGRVLGRDRAHARVLGRGRSARLDRRALGAEARPSGIRRDRLVLGLGRRGLRPPVSAQRSRARHRLGLRRPLWPRLQRHARELPVRARS